MLAENNPQMKKAVGVLMELSADEQTRLLYESREKARWDERARLREAREDGLSEGEARGRAEGKAEVARKLLLRGNPIDEITELTGLSRGEIERL